MSEVHLNLDRLAAKHAQAIVQKCNDLKARDLENAVTKALAVLQENGVYACFLYLLAKEKEYKDNLVDQMLALLEGLGFGWKKPENLKPEQVLIHIQERVTGNLERLLLAKETLEQMLIYARYGAKAKG